MHKTNKVISLPAAPIGGLGRITIETFYDNVYGHRLTLDGGQCKTSFYLSSKFHAVSIMPGPLSVLMGKPRFISVLNFMQ